MKIAGIAVAMAMLFVWAGDSQALSSGLAGDFCGAEQLLSDEAIAQPARINSNWFLYFIFSGIPD